MYHTESSIDFVGVGVLGPRYYQHWVWVCVTGTDGKTGPNLKKAIGAYILKFLRPSSVSVIILESVHITLTLCTFMQALFCRFLINISGTNWRQFLDFLTIRILISRKEIFINITGTN